MADFSFNPLHIFHPVRDSYGFALRPQYAQRYREYSLIYKEEENERSDKWRSFLEQVAKTSQPSSSDNKHKETSETEGNEVKEESNPDRESKEDNSDNKHKETSEAEGNEVKEESNPDRESKEDNSSSKKSSEGTDVEEKTGADSIKEGDGSSGRKSSEETILDRLTEGGDSSGRKSSGGTEKQEGTSPGRVREGDISIDRKSVSDSPTRNNNSEKELHHPEQRKIRTVRSWAEIRSSLTSIEEIMSSRVKKGKNMRGKLMNGENDHLECIEAFEPVEGISEEDIQEPVCSNETLDNNITESREGNAFVDPDSPWKELESLVQGGVPKDLRGEVWQAFVGVKTRRVESYYKDLLAQETNSGESNENDVPSVALGKWRKQIEKDIPRTFPGHPALDENGRNSLRRLLLAYARHNPSVGYCQAMNFFAGLLLLLMPEENAFWAFVGIIDDYFEGYYTEEMIESQVDQLVFEELMRERFPKLVNHLDYLGVQVAWISGPWFLSIFVNMIPWESVIRVWDVMLFEGNRVMLFRTALALMELYGPALVTTKDAGDAITLLQSLAGSTFDSSQLVFTACMGYLAVTEARLQELREKHRPSVLEVIEERSMVGQVRKDSKGLASKLYSFKHEKVPLVEEKKTSKEDNMVADEDKSPLESHSSNIDELLNSLNIDPEVDSLPGLDEQVVWLKVELCRLLEEKKTAVLRAEELETAFMEMVKEDNRLQLSAKVEQLEQEVAELREALDDKKEQEAAMLQVLMRLEQDQKDTEDARRRAEQELAAQKLEVFVLQEKYEKATASIAEMQKRVVMAESLLEATLQYESGTSKAISSPGAAQSPRVEIPSRSRIGLLSFGWRKGNPAESSESNNATPRKKSNNQENEK